MGILSSPAVLRNISPKKQQNYGMRSNYHQVDGKCHKKNNMQTIKLGCDNSNKRYSCWKMKKILKLRVKMGSPLKLWRKLKNAYLSLAAAGINGGGSSNLNTGKRIPKARKVHPTYTNQEFQDRLIFEIYKNMVASRELATQ